MRWEGRKQSDNVEDRRGQSGGGGGLIKGGGILGLIIMLIGMYYGVDLSGVVGSGNETVSTSTQQAPPSNVSQQEAQLNELARVTLADTEQAWGSYFQQNNIAYVQPKLVLYRDATQTACGTGQAAMGPFYCPADQKVYLDLSFYDDMKRKLGASGDFAFAYVLAHEVGHHVQNVLGINQKVSKMQQRTNQAGANRLSVMLELQADCFAGVWGNYMQKQNLLDAGDVEEAMNAAAAVGDDRIQHNTTGRIIPDSFTHGTSEQRMTWFNRGMQSGDPNQCNTFASR